MQKLKILLSILLFFGILGAALYFRSYGPLYRKMPPQAKMEASASQQVILNLQRQVAEQIAGQYPDISEEERMALALKRAEQVRTQSPEQFEAAVNKILALQYDPSIVGSTRNYLLGADSYHYLYLTDQIRKTGRIADEMHHGKYLNKLRGAPQGIWSPLNIHPYLGYLWYQVLKIFRSDRVMMEALCFFPFLLVLFSALAFLFVMRELNMEVFSSLAGMTALLMAPVFIQRSNFGWYDTDPYNVLFPLLVLAFFVRGVSCHSRPALTAAFCGFFTALYSLFWVGWPFIFVFVAGMGLFLVALHYMVPGINVPQALRFTLFYLLWVGVFAFIFMTPAGFYESLRDTVVYGLQFRAGDTGAWPDIFITVGETRAITLKKLIFLTLNPVTAGLAVAGIAGYAAGCRYAPGRYRWQHWIMMVSLGAALTYLSLGTERFSLLCVVPFSIFIAWAFYSVGDLAVWMLSRRTKKEFWKPALRTLVFTVMLLAGLPYQLILAHAVARQAPMIMNDAWFAVLNEIKLETEEDAIILAWWPPGHFLTAISNRSVFTDGGSQHLPEAYWTSRFYMAASEKEAYGILRMLVSGGNDAVDYLQKEKGLLLSQVIDLINEIILLDRDEAAERLASVLNPQETMELLSLTHHEHLRPTYVFLFDEMTEKNLAMSVMARWDFRRAEEWKLRKHKSSLDGNYVQQSMNLSGNVLRYQPPSEVKKRNGNRLLFANQVEVNLDDMDVKLIGKETNRAGRLKSVVYEEDGRFMEKSWDNPALGASVLLWQQNDAWYSLLADRELLESMLFRMFYLNGAGLNFVKKVNDIRGKSLQRYMLYRVSWEGQKGKEE